MTDHEYDFDLEGFRTARINSAHYLGDYVVEWWDDGWEDRFCAEMEEIKVKEISKFQERLAQEVFDQPVTETIPGGSLIVARPSEVTRLVEKECREENLDSTSTNGGSKTLQSVGNSLREEDVATLPHLDIERDDLTDAIMVDREVKEDATEVPSSLMATEDELHEDSSLRLTGSATVEIAPSTSATSKRKGEDIQPKKPPLPPSSNSRSQIASSTNPFRITRKKKPRPKTTFTWLHSHRMTIAITIKHFNLSWSNLERVFSYIYPEDVKKGGKVPGSAAWAGNIRFQWVRESRAFKSAKYYDPVQAEIEVEEGEESVEYKKILADVVGAMGTLGITSRLGIGERKVLDFTKK